MYVKQSRGISTVLAIVVVIVIIAAAASGVYLAVSTSGPSSSSSTSPSTSSTPTMTTTATSTTTTVSSTTSCTKSSCVQVEIPPGAPAGPGFSPDTITVVIGKNATVVWTNDDDVYHTVTSNPGDPMSLSSSQDPGITPDGGTFQYTFTVAGTYNYHCIFHSLMKGTVIVLSLNA